MKIKVGSEWFAKDDSQYTATVVWSNEAHVHYTRNGDPNIYEVDVPAFMSKYTTYPPKDVINAPQHYQVFPDKEAIEIIASSMTTEQFYGYCLGNFLKYRLRIGAKDEVQQELGKSNKYKELYEKHKHLCK